METECKVETKEELVTNIKEWIKMDAEMARLQKEMKEYRNKKKTLTDSLVNVMKKNEIDCFDINGGSLVYKKSVTKKPINAKTLMQNLKTFFSNKQSDVSDEIVKYILENREQTVKETICRKVDK
jgi:seryl-tRNA synthetase